MPTETRTTDNVAGITEEIPQKVAGDTISHEDFLKMIDVLEALEQHDHTFDDKYYANCQCQCDSGGMV